MRFRCSGECQETHPRPPANSLVSAVFTGEGVKRACDNPESISSTTRSGRKAPVRTPTSR